MDSSEVYLPFADPVLNEGRAGTGASSKSLVPILAKYQGFEGVEVNISIFPNRGSKMEDAPRRYPTALARSGGRFES